MTTAFLHGLRMLGDLLIYSAFASFFAACLGGGLAPLLLLLPAFCYGVSACFSQRRILRTGCAVLSLLGLLLFLLSGFKGEYLRQICKTEIPWTRAQKNPCAAAALRAGPSLLYYNTLSL